MINTIQLNQVRNIASASLKDLKKVNIISGLNGSGKTSVLEAVHLVATGKSFRTHRAKHLIQNSTSDLVVHVKVDHPAQSIATQRFRNGDKLIKLGQNTVQTFADIADVLRVRAIHASTFELLTGGPDVRRQYLDWGVFHVEHKYLNTWKHYIKCLKQRNDLLRRDRIDQQNLTTWTRLFCQYAEQVHDYRLRYFESLRTVLTQRLSEIGFEDMQFDYRQGWSKDLTLPEALEQRTELDIKRGYTSVGPQRADLAIKASNNMLASDMFSRGQQKLLAASMILIQAVHLNQSNAKKTVLLVDDLPSELDTVFQSYLMNVIQETDAQLFVTGIDQDQLVDLMASVSDDEIQMFHVEQGVIAAS